MRRAILVGNFYYIKEGGRPPAVGTPFSRGFCRPSACTCNTAAGTACPELRGDRRCSPLHNVRIQHSLPWRKLPVSAGAPRRTSSAALSCRLRKETNQIISYFSPAFKNKKENLRWHGAPRGKISAARGTSCSMAPARQNPAPGLTLNCSSARLPCNLRQDRRPGDRISHPENSS